MVLIYTLPVTISSLLIAAHFYRSGMIVLTGICLLIPFLQVLRRRWVPKLVIFFLLSSSLEWLRTLFDLIGIYKTHGASYTRLTVILTLVNLFTLASVLVFRTESMKRRYVMIPPEE